MIRAALVGYGYWGPNIAHTTEHIPHVELVYICDQDNSIIKKISQFHPKVKAVKDIQIILDDKTIDCVILATPVRSHFSLAARVLRSNKHVLIEKPLTASLHEAEKLEKIQKKINKIVMVGHTFEYNTGIRKIKEHIKAEEIGKIYYVYSQRVNLGQIRGDINAVWNLAPHDISILNFILDASPIEVMATGASFLQKNIEDVAFVNLKYPNDVFANIQVSWLDPLKVRRLTIVGSKKMLIFDDLDNESPIKIYDKHADTGEIARGTRIEYKIKLHSGDIYAPQIDIKEPLKEELKHFFDCIEKGKTPLSDLQNGKNVVRILEAIQESLNQHNRWVSI